jgi:hypothetical protein
VVLGGAPNSGAGGREKKEREKEKRKEKSKEMKAYYRSTND